jgi:putative endonuclease
MKRGWVYILQCSNGSFYTGSTIDLNKRFREHQNGLGSNYTKKHLPVKLVYYEEFPNIKLAFEREKQIQGWRRKKKKALINGKYESLPKLSHNYSQFSDWRD